MSEEAGTISTDLTPDPSIQVPKDEAVLGGSGDHGERLKHLFNKSRTSREQLIAREADEHVDAAMLVAMNAEVAGGAAPTTQIDTNRDDDGTVPASFKDSDEVTRDREKLRLAKEQEEKSTKPIAGKELSAPVPSAIVAVKILGKEYQVPQQDIDDAGGVELYQKSRAANLRLQRIATLEKALPPKQTTVPAHGTQQHADPSLKDGLDDADITRLRERVVDALVDGEDIEAVDRVLKEELVSRRKSQPQPTQVTNPADSTKPNPVVLEARLELERQQADDMREANDMMRKDYADIINDGDLLAMARSRFHALSADPNNVGRTQKELSRESAQWVRDFGKKFAQPSQRQDEVEEQRQERITRKRKLPQASNANAPAAQSAPEQLSTQERRRRHLAELQNRSSGR